MIRFIMEIESLSYPDAVRFLAKRAGLDVPEDPEYQSRYRKQERLWALCQEAARFFHGTLYSPAGRPGSGMRDSGGCPRGPSPDLGWDFAPNRWDGLTRCCHGEKGVYRGGTAGCGAGFAQ
ncbi:MAG: hypothetical protein ACLU9S_24290 [Oscillospiraceae bacterium]